MQLGVSLTVDAAVLALDEVDAPEERKGREVWEEVAGVIGACVWGCVGVGVYVCMCVNVTKSVCVCMYECTYV